MLMGCLKFLHIILNLSYLLPVTIFIIQIAKGKLQISNYKLQINYKLQYSMFETFLEFRISVIGFYLIFGAWNLEFNIYGYGNEAEIFFSDGSKTTQLTKNYYHDGFPQISGSNIVWRGGYVEDGVYKIFLAIPSGNQHPVANAGEDQEVTDSDENGSEVVTLVGSGSYDNDVSIVSYTWKEGVTELGTGVNPSVSVP